MKVLVKKQTDSTRFIPHDLENEWLDAKVYADGIYEIKYNNTLFYISSEDVYSQDEINKYKYLKGITDETN